MKKITSTDVLMRPPEHPHEQGSFLHLIVNHIHEGMIAVELSRLGRPAGPEAKQHGGRCSLRSHLVHFQSRLVQGVL